MPKRHGFHGPYHRKAAGPRLPTVAGLSPADLKKLLDSIEPAERPAARGRKPADGMNATERRYAGELDFLQNQGLVIAYWYEPMSLKLAPNTHYRPDFLVLADGGGLEIHEVKGAHVEEDAWVKVKVAAAMFPFRFRVCQWRDKGWHITDL